MTAQDVGTPTARGAEPQADVALSVHNLWKVFGPHADKVVGTPDADLSRQELKKKTGCVIGVKDVSFDVAQGEVFVVMGLSGSGKSTLVRCLTRLIEPTAGTVNLDGVDVTAASESQLRDVRRNRVSMVFQHFGLLPHRQVIDNISYGLEIRGMGKKERRAKAMEVCELVGLDGYETSYPDQLSGGMQQRVGLARALAGDPSMLLFDEPFSALDPLIRRDMQSEVIRLHRELGKTMVFITHDLQEALKLGDRILIMRDGEMVQIGSPDEVVARPADDYVKNFVSDVPKSHVLTLRWVMRPAEDGAPVDGPILQADVVVREAARAVLANHGPVRVAEGDRIVGVVDDEDILRVVVAEEEPMSSATLERQVEPGAAPPPPPEPRRFPRWAWALLVLGTWIVLWRFTEGNDTLVVPALSQTDRHEDIGDFANGLGGSAITELIADAINGIFDFFQGLISTPNPPRPAPTIGWLGVVAIATWIGYAVANWRIALLVAASFFSFGLFGFWEDSMDLLIVTLMSVAFAVLIGFPIAVWIGLSRRGERVVTPVLDLLQTMPTFVYLMFVFILFGIGAPNAVVCTVLYALPPIVRIAGFGIRDVSPTAIEATDSLGQSTWQRLRKVQIPMARSTIILGLNQTILAALSIAIIAGYVNGPGLGKPVLSGLTRNDFGAGLVPGLLIVIMGIMLDRTTTAASERSEKVARGGGEDLRRRRTTLGLLLIPVAVAVWYSRYAIDAAVFPENDLTRRVADWANGWMESVTTALDGAAGTFKDLVTYGLLNPMQSLLADSPWWLAFAGLFAMAVVIGGARAVAPALVCLTGLYLLDLWHDAMVVLNMTLVATLLVMVLALAFGVWMARSHRADLVIRPVLDAGQTIPAFVYLIPVLALFGPTRFTAIVAGVIYAAPASIKLVADGVRGVSPGVVEAGRSTGSTRWQEITKVQLPMAKGSLVLATNQGLLYVLAMVVIGGLVGAGALGYDVVYALAHSTDYGGKGIAAGFSIVLLGIFIDRVTRAAAERAGRGSPTNARRSWTMRRRPTGW